MAKKSDPQEDPDFQAVVQHFLNTKPQPRPGSKENQKAWAKIDSGKKRRLGNGDKKKAPKGG